MAHVVCEYPSVNHAAPYATRGLCRVIADIRFAAAMPLNYSFIINDLEGQVRMIHDHAATLTR